MKKIVIITILFTIICGYHWASAQKINYGGTLEGLEGKAFDNKLIEIAKEAVLKYAPEFYREYKYPDISGPTIARTTNPKHIPIAIAAVIFFYDPAKEKMQEDFAASVVILVESGKVSDILLGNGMLLTGLENADDKIITPVSYLPHWDKNYNSENVTYLEEAKSYLLWGWKEGYRKDDRRSMEKRFANDSIDREFKKIDTALRELDKNDGPAAEMDAIQKRHVKDSIIKEYYRMLDERKKRDAAIRD